MNSTILNFLSAPWPFWAGGLAIGSVVLLSYFWQQKAIGVTGGFEAACALILPKPSKKSKNKNKRDVSWKIWFVLGIPLGALVAHLLTSGSLDFHWHMGQFDQMISSALWMKFLFFFGGGLLIGYGTRMADGCPSGHSIVGIAMGSWASILATAIFMAVAFLTVQIIYYVIF
jgi:uncharacterized membrane protein YedE/YeeE